MSSAIVERILEEVKKLTADEQRALRKALAHEPPPPAPAFNTHEREHAWVERNRDEYLNQWSPSTATACSLTD
ncbi:MAG: hypothetical protein ABW007_15460 [Chitinophagaceae bacterium]